MKHIKLILVILVCASIKIVSQENVSLSFEANYNSFSLSSLKSFQNELKDDLTEIQLRNTDEFPANVGYTFGVRVKSINTNFFVFYNTTGARLSYSDFSGVIRVSQSLQGIGFGGEYQLALDTKDQFYLNLRSFINFSSINLETYSEILDTKNIESIDFNSRDLGIGFAFMYEYPISFFKLKINVGYDFTFVGDVFLKGNDQAFLTNDNNENVKTNWSGFRTGLGVSIPLN